MIDNDPRYVMNEDHVRSFSILLRSQPPRYHQNELNQPHVSHHHIHPEVIDNYPFPQHDVLTDGQLTIPRYLPQSGLFPSPDDLASPSKRKMDLNSQLQAAASFSPIDLDDPSTIDDPNSIPSPPAKRPRTNTPWTPEEERRLKELRDIGTSWSVIAKSFPNRTEGSVKKHWYKDMHYAEFTEEEKAILFEAIRDYDANKWKVIGNKVGKPAKACEQFAREHFSGK